MSIVLHSRSGPPDSKLHLEIPVGQPDTDFEVEVMVMVRPKLVTRTLPPGYFDLIGSLDDEMLIVHPQPTMPGLLLEDWETP